LQFCVKLFHLMRGVHIRCFCSLKVHEKHIWAQVDFWFWVEFGFLNGFLRPWIGLSWFLRCFISVFSNKWVENGFLGLKEHWAWFSSHCSGRNLGKTNDALSALIGDASPAFFKEQLDGRYVVRPSAIKKEAQSRGPW
jgi:hypothetical protein